MFRAAHNLMLSKYLNINIEDYTFNNNFRDQYCNTVSGKLDCGIMNQ